MIIGLTGPQRAGKTTVYNHMVTAHRFVPLSIADEIKSVSHGLVGYSFSDEEKDEPQEVLNGATPRDLYIYVGQLDEFQNPLWVNRMFRERYQGPGRHHVIESVGKPFQWLAVMKFAQANNDQCVIFDVWRPEHEYRDSRSPVIDFVNMLRVENKREMADLYRELDEFYIPALTKMKVERTNEQIDKYAESIASAG